MIALIVCDGDSCGPIAYRDGWAEWHNHDCNHSVERVRLAAFLLLLWPPLRRFVQLFSGNCNAFRHSRKYDALRVYFCKSGNQFPSRKPSFPGRAKNRALLPGAEKAAAYADSHPAFDDAETMRDIHDR